MTSTALTLESAKAVRGLRGNIPSPCLSICRMDARRATCEGCWRTIDEIARWSSIGDTEKKAVWALIEQRIQAAPLCATTQSVTP